MYLRQYLKQHFRDFIAGLCVNTLSIGEEVPSALEREMITYHLKLT